MIDVKDKQWNRIYTRKLKKLLKVYLKLRGAAYERSIGVIDKPNKTLIVNRDPRTHSFIKTDSYWFNHQLVSILDDDWIVIVRQPWTRIIYKTTIKDIKEKGKFLNFAEQWFELQQFMSKSSMEKDIELKK